MYSIVQNWHAREVEPQNIAIHFVEEKNLAICNIVNFMLHTNLLHVWRVAHHFTTRRVLACKQVLDSTANNDMKLLLEYKVLGCRILVEET
jgi:hypothetical protein